MFTQMPLAFGRPIVNSYILAGEALQFFVAFAFVHLLSVCVCVSNKNSRFLAIFTKAVWMDWRVDQLTD